MHIAKIQTYIVTGSFEMNGFKDFKLLQLSKGSKQVYEI